MLSFRLRHPVAAAFIFSVLSLARLPASPTNPTTESPPAAEPYTNQIPSVSQYIVETGPPPSSYSDGSSPSSGGTTYTYVTVVLDKFCFPPVPPALGEPLPFFRRLRSSDTEARLPQLLPLVGEPFYAPLSAHLEKNRLSKKRLARIEAYTAARAGLLEELRALLAAAPEGDPAARRSALAALAVRQAPRLAALELEAEAVRDDLVRGGLFADGADWNDNRSWRLGEDLRYESGADEFKVVRAAAFFTAGLSPAQRRLLRELAMELDDPRREPTADLELGAPRPRCAFSPETARIDLPAALAPEIAAKIDAYRDAKAALKSELRAALYRHDRDFFRFARTQALRTLAERQAPRFAAVEALAEEIRVALAALPPPAPDATEPPLPDELVRQLTFVIREQQDLQRAMLAQLAAVKAEFPVTPGSILVINGGYGIGVLGLSRTNKESAARVEAIQAKLAPFNEAQARRFAELRKIKSLRTEFEAVVRSRLTAASDTREASELLRNLSAQFTRLEMRRRYRDYETAVLEPGLSPEQRRLLFSHALAQLDLPLPPGSRQP